jgi:putative addiction module killer protein
MTETPFRLEYYLEDDGGAPFIEWMSNLRDRNAHARISARLNRVKLGNFGVVKALGDGVSELKIDYGPGYRIYYAMKGKTVVLLLIGGGKSTQTQDVKDAKANWKRHQRGGRT